MESVTMIKLLKLLAVCLMQITICTGIEIKLEADDAIKILNALMASPLFRGLINDFRKSSPTEYHNPYHPEDVTFNIDEQISSTQATTIDSIENANLEIENKNFNNTVSEDELADPPEDPSMKVTTPNYKFNPTNNSALEVVDQHNTVQDVIDEYSPGPKPYQKRFSIFHRGSTSS